MKSLSVTSSGAVPVSCSFVCGLVLLKWQDGSERAGRQLRQMLTTASSWCGLCLPCVRMQLPTGQARPCKP